MCSSNREPLLSEQIAYYRARASEYDEWFERRGRYDRGPEQNALWFQEIAEVRQALDAFAPAGKVIELACGTGNWTQHLLNHASSLTAVDASPEMLAIHRAKIRDDRVRYIEADLLDWAPEERFDVVFFGFWLSHVPPDRFAGFWELVQALLKPGGRVFFVDSLFTPASTARDHQLESEDALTLTRRLNDGRAFRIYKLFYRPAELERRLSELGWRATVRATSQFFLYGSAAVIQ